MGGRVGTFLEALFELWVPCPALASGQMFMDAGALLQQAHGGEHRSLQGFPWGSAEARLYMIRRLAGQAQPQLSWAPGTPGGSGSRRAARFRSGAGNTPQ